MSTTRGIFESFPEQPAARPDSPFAIVHEPETAAPASPFSAPPRVESPFAIVADDEKPEHGKPVKLPERRKTDSPFQMAEPQEGFGFEAPQAFAAPFEAPAASPFEAPTASPFATATPASSPFGMEPAKTPAPASTPSVFANWQPAASTPAPAPVSAPPAFQSPPPPVEAPAPVAAPISAPVAAPVAVDNQSDSFSIRQLELRAIFGVDREMNAEEILQRTRALPGIRNIARVSQPDMASVDALKNLLGNLGFGGGTLKLYSGSVPLDFIREGGVLLAVQTDGGFAPGVRETLMIVARELGRMG